MSLSTPIAPITFPSLSRRADALREVGITSPVAERGLSRALRVTPRSTTSRRAAVNSRVSSSLMKRESDCSTTSSCRKPSSCETASLAWRILPSRSETNTGSGADLMMMSATRTSRVAAPSVSAVEAPSRRVLTGGFMTFLATASSKGIGRCLEMRAHCAHSCTIRQDPRLLDDDADVARSEEHTSELQSRLEPLDHPEARRADADERVAAPVHRPDRALAGRDVDRAGSRVHRSEE